MPLPDLIEIVPPDKPVHAEISVPGSKSITNRALILAALGEGETTLEGALWSEDTQVMVEALQQLNFEVRVEPDREEVCNRRIIVRGAAGRIPRAGTAQEPFEIFVGNAGTAARFLAALVCLGNGVYRLRGVPRMHERPQAALFQALRALGYRIDSPNDKLPADIYGTGPRAGKCAVSIEESSQFASALLMAGHGRGWEIQVTGANADEQPYVDMTRALIQAMPAQGGLFRIEPDASSGSYFLGAGWLLRAEGQKNHDVDEPMGAGAGVTTISVRHWPKSGWQIDAEFLHLIANGDAPEAVRTGTGSRADVAGQTWPAEVSREQHLGDSIMTVAVLAPFVGRKVRLTDLGRLRIQESERVAALRTELTKCGAQVEEQGDTLTIMPSAVRLHGAEIETYNDHRMAMCFSILGLKVPGMKIKNPACVKKTFPNFFQKLAGLPPDGLGVTIRNGRTGRTLTKNELFAE